MPSFPNTPLTLANVVWLLWDLFLFAQKKYTQHFVHTVCKMSDNPYRFLVKTIYACVILLKSLVVIESVKL